MKICIEFTKDEVPDLRVALAEKFDELMDLVGEDENYDENLPEEEENQLEIEEENQLEIEEENQLEIEEENQLEIEEESQLEIP
jgi:hypothetical protein